MQYTKEQVDAAVNATSAECFIEHVLGVTYCEAVFVAMQLSHDSDGRLTNDDLAHIDSLMP